MNREYNVDTAKIEGNTANRPEEGREMKQMIITKLMDTFTNKVRKTQEIIKGKTVLLS